MKLEPVVSAILDVVQRYVERQQLVLQVIQSLRPDLLMLGNRLASDEPIGKFLNDLHEVQKQVSDIPQKGYWGEDNVWEYFFHGLGCRLVHTQTGEPIDWNVPDLQRFDKFSFLNYVEWLLRNEAISTDVESIKATLLEKTQLLKDLVFEVLDQLCELGYLSQAVSSNTYALQ